MEWRRVQVLAYGLGVVVVVVVDVMSTREGSGHIFYDLKKKERELGRLVSLNLRGTPGITALGDFGSMK